MLQPSLFDEPVARVHDPDTSHEAAARVKPTAATTRALAFETLKAWPGGLTDFELAALTGVAQTSIGVRRGELVKLGQVERTDKRRPSPSGSPAYVWRVVPRRPSASEFWDRLR